MEVIPAEKKAHVFKFVSPPGGAKVHPVPGALNAGAFDLPRNVKVRVLGEYRDISSPSGKIEKWSRIEFESGSQIKTGWIRDESLLGEEIRATEKDESFIYNIDKTRRPAGIVTGKFMVAECVYNPGYEKNPYFFLGSRKQHISFNEDGRCDIEINTCGGLTPDEGSFVQTGNTISAEIGRESILVEILNSDTLLVRTGAGFISCNVCREVYLVRTDE